MKNSARKILKLFKVHKVLDIKILEELLNGRSARSIYRDLKKEKYLSSFTHAGRYYSLPAIPKFNTEGLWHYKNIGFSKHGTLKESIFFLVNNSSDGKTHEELEEVFKIRVHNALLDLVSLNRIDRKLVDHTYVYLSSKKVRATAQLKDRKKIVELSLEVRITIFVEIIKSSVMSVNSTKLLLGLKKRGIKITLKEIERMLEVYDIKKNSF